MTEKQPDKKQAIEAIAREEITRLITATWADGGIGARETANKILNLPALRAYFIDLEKLTIIGDEKIKEAAQNHFCINEFQIQWLRAVASAQLKADQLTEKQLEGK